MLVDLVRVTTADDIRLDGALLAPAANVGRPAPAADAWLLVHGTGGCFYSSTMFDAIAESLAALGSAALLVNTRGHDGVSTAHSTPFPKRLGAAYEAVDDCRLDLAAWIEFLVSRGHRRIGLLGHSLGGVKIVYFTAQQPHPAVKLLIALSPPRLSFSHYSQSAKKSLFLADLAEAQAHVDAGRPQALLDVRFPLPYLVTAAGYVEKYGPEERYQVLKHLANVNLPSLVTYGSAELSYVAFGGMPEAIEAMQAAQPNLQSAVIAGADHSYSGCRTELVAGIQAWLMRLPSAP